MRRTRVQEIVSNAGGREEEKKGKTEVKVEVLCRRGYEGRGTVRWTMCWTGGSGVGV